MTTSDYAAGSATEILEKCEAVCLDFAFQTVRDWKEAHPGKKAMGFLPTYVPRELIHAAGMLPVGILGADDSLEIVRGDACFQSYICHLPRSVVELGMTGRLDCIDGMLFPSTCDVIRNLSGIWKLQFPGKLSLYFDAPQNFDMQVGGTAGNLWSHQITQDAIDGGRTYFDSFGQRVALDPTNDVRREVPFMDVAYKNGQRMLYDASAEIRMNSLLMQGGFDSFFRVSYGFNEIKGINDVNGDDISDTSDPGTGNSVSQETEKPGPRFYLGIGTGW